MLKKTLILFSLLLLLSKLSAQNNAALKYEAVSFSINKTLLRIKPDYFKFEKPIPMPSLDYDADDTTIFVAYNENYEEITMNGKEYKAFTSTPEKIAQAKKDAELWDFKEKLGKKVVLITSYPIKDQKERLKGYQPFKHSPTTKTQQKLARALSKVDAVFWDTKRLSSENYLFIENTKENGII
jgi:hypothetical protein